MARTGNSFTFILVPKLTLSEVEGCSSRLLLLNLCRLQKLRRLSRLHQLLEPIRDLQQRWLTPGTAKERDTYWQSEDESCRHINVGISRHRRRVRTPTRRVI